MNIIKNRPQLIRLLFLFCIFLCMAPASLKGQKAVPSANYSGSRTTAVSGAFTTSGTWSSGLKVAWNISFSAAANRWNYTYTISKASGASLASTTNLFYLQAAWDLMVANM